LQPIFTKFGEFVDLTDVITPAKFGYKIFVDFSRPRGGKSHFPYRKQTAYITVPCATMLACDECRAYMEWNNCANISSKITSMEIENNHQIEIRVGVNNSVGRCTQYSHK